MNKAPSSSETNIQSKYEINNRKIENNCKINEKYVWKTYENGVNYLLCVGKFFINNFLGNS